MEPSILMRECGVRQTRNHGAGEGGNRARLRWEPQYHNPLRGPLAEEALRLTWLHAGGPVAF